MDFSEGYRCSGPAPVFSPDGQFTAAAVEHRLIIREVETQRVVQLYPCLDRIDSLEWSPNSTYVLVGLFSRGIIQVWSVDSPDWSCKIDEGPAGVASVRWSPDGSCVLATSEFGLRVTVWSLRERSCAYLRGPKHVRAGAAFSADGAHLAVLERSEMKDWVTVYDTSSWGEAARFPLPTSDAADLAWSPEGGVLAVWDSCLQYKVALLDASSGATLATYAAYGPEALGVKCVSWSPAGELLAVGSFDRVARLLNHELDEPGPGPSSTARSLDPAARSKYVITPLPASVPRLNPPLDAPSPKIGVGRCAWSGDGRFLATVEDSSGPAVWVWDLGSMELGAVLLHMAPVTDLAWAPQGSTLAVVTGATKVHLWTPAGASIVHIPLPGFQAFGCSWSRGGTTLLVRGPDSFCCAYLTA
ncbi:hypothetical protein GPECTOR_8g67 [Gonium pectorale]|uniref:Uncharacterized protein n=1 Tax=Gonium pectorale TaxID=33097 RepID=A0A150GTH0_GONPE|nr:hypothetical protein GPECTOR_8g67 [Gonium pectorale]|eukprot:KXZ53074.1 hypothetical protein GPECTOR_8g67 [Gonium pectorale]